MGGSSGPPPQQTTTNVASPQQQALFNTVFPQVQQWAAQGPPQPYSGNVVAPMTPQQTTGWENIIQTAEANRDPALLNYAAGGIQDLPNRLTPFEGTDPFAGFTMQDIRGDLNWDPLANERLWNPAMNPALNQAILAAQRPVAQQFTESVLPNIRGGAITAGGIGGSRQGIAEGIAAGRFGQTQGDISSRMAMDAYSNNLNAMVQTYLGNINALNQRYGTNVAGANQRYGTNVGAEQARYGTNIDALLRSYGMTPALQAGLTQAEYGPDLARLQYGDLLQRQNQAEIQADVARYNYSRLAPFLQAQEVMSLAQGFPGGSTVATGSVPQAGTNWANAPAAALGGAATGAAVGSVVPGIGTGIGAGVGAGAAMLPFLFR